MTTQQVQDAEQQLARATESAGAAGRNLTALKNKILTDGPTAVSAQELADAAAGAEHATLSVQHATAVLQTAQGDARLQHLHGLKAGILTGAGDPDDALAAMDQIEKAAAYLIETCAGRQQRIAQWTRTMQLAGVPASIGTQDQDGHAGLGWSAASMAGGDAVTVDQRRISPLNSGLLIAAALARAARAAGYSTGHLAPALQVDSKQGAAEDPEGWLRKRY